MSVTLFLNFVRAGQFRSERAYYFIGSPQSGFPTAQTNIAKDFEWSRSINKNIITTKVPSDTYTGGGIGLDIGMTEDTFELSLVTYDYSDFRYLGSLIKRNKGLRTADLHVNVNGVNDTFAVSVRNAQFKMPFGKGFRCEIKLSLIVVNPVLSGASTA